MPKYRVEVREVHVQAYIIEAENVEDAKIRAANEGDIDEGNFYYSHSLGPEHSTVEEITEPEYPTAWVYDEELGKEVRWLSPDTFETR